ncbi:MAG: dihydroorotase [Candidatus Metalachnospira sp.]|nr:dihydroorotase [Candidatus Metalachnospira sp.]
MDYLLRNANVYINNEFKKTDIHIKDNIIVSTDNCCDNSVSFDFNNCFIFPGFTDVHVHLREPGFLYKETIRTGTMAAAHGGYTSICAMPNLKPVPDSVDTIKEEVKAIENSAVIHVYPYGAITKSEQGNELSDMEEMSEYAIGFSDDGRGVQNDEMMREAMIKAKSLGKIIVAHCEDNELLDGGYIHKGKYAEIHGHKGICSESEWKQIERDLKLVKETGCKYHVCHISTKESVELIRKAKAEGLNVTCETGPHYLVFNDMDLKEEGRFKMNPPIRDESDRLALIEGIKDGTIDVIATDHAPHTAEEKGKGLKNSLMGIVGLETAFPVLYSELVKKKIISLEKLVELLNVNAAKIFGIGTQIKEGQPADLTVFDLDNEYTVNSDDFLSKGKSTPFEGKKVLGKCLMTIVNGEIVWKS